MKKFTLGSVAFLTGVLAGAGTGLLTAPQTGVRTRRRLRRVADDVGERTTDLVHDVKGKLDRAVTQTRRWIR